MNILRLSIKNILFKPLSTTLSLILFALGVGLISILLILGKQVQDKFDSNLAGIDLVIGAKGSPLQLILCSMYHVDNPTGNIGIKEATPFLRDKHPLIETSIPLSLGDSHKGYRIVGTTDEIIELYEGKVGEGTVWNKPMEVTVGRAVAEDLNLSIGDEFFSSHGFVQDENLVHDEAGSFKVVGILEPSGAVIDQLILTSPESVWAVHEHGTEEAEASDSTGGHVHYEELKPVIEYQEKDITSILIKFKGRNFQALNMQRSINENTEMQAATPAIEINRLYSNLGVGIDALNVLALVIVIVSGLSVFISLFSSLSDRKYELALMRTMGASPVTLFLLIILEGVLLALLGYILGIAISHIGMEVLAGFMKDSYRYSFSGMVFLQKEILLLAGAIGVGFVAAVIPAIQASRTDISTTLSEG